MEWKIWPLLRPIKHSENFQNIRILGYLYMDSQRNSSFLIRKIMEIELILLINDFILKSFWVYKVQTSKYSILN